MPASAPKLAFDNGGAFIQDTRREVEQYLARGSTRVKGARTDNRRLVDACGPKATNVVRKERAGEGIRTLGPALTRRVL